MGSNHTTKRASLPAAWGVGLIAAAFVSAGARAESWTGAARDTGWPSASATAENTLVYAAPRNPATNQELAGIASDIIDKTALGRYGVTQSKYELYDPGAHQGKLLPWVSPEISPTEAHAPLPGAWPLALLGGVLVAKLRKRFA